MTVDIKLPPLPTPDADHYDNGTFAPVWKEGKMEAYARAAIAPYKQRIAEMEAGLEAIGAGGVNGRVISGQKGQL